MSTLHMYTRWDVKIKNNRPLVLSSELFAHKLVELIKQNNRVTNNNQKKKKKKKQTLGEFIKKIKITSSLIEKSRGNHFFMNSANCSSGNGTHYIKYFSLYFYSKHSLFKYKVILFLPIILIYFTHCASNNVIRPPSITKYVMRGGIIVL